MENGTYEKIVTHFERELELNCLEAPDELKVFTVTQHDSKTNADSPIPTCHRCGNPRHNRNQSRQPERQKEPAEGIQKIREKTVVPTSLPRITAMITTILTKTVIEQKQSQKVLTRPVGHVEKQTTSQINTIVEQMQSIDHLPRTNDRK